MVDRIYAPEVQPVERPVQKKMTFMPEMVEVDRLVRATEGRKLFRIDGSGMTVAVLDTGLRVTHSDFTGRVLPGRNFTQDNGGDAADVSDGNGHGTNVAGIICAGAIHTGIAPGARIVPLKVLTNEGGGDFAVVRDALQWVIDHRADLDISAVCMSLGDPGNYRTDLAFPGDGIEKRLRSLTEQGVPCCVAAGNDYFRHNSAQGMCYPAIFRTTVSVGAVYDAVEGGFNYKSGAIAFATGPDRITPYSQRLHEKVGGDCATDIFAPGAPVTSSGIDSDSGTSIQQGTSQATPVIAGTVLLLQAYYLKNKGSLPAVADILRWLRRGAATIEDGDDEKDNVLHTGLTFHRVDVVGALKACASEILVDELVVDGAGVARLSA
jgi:subtilisin family serine protease